MERLLQSIGKSLKDENWYSALILSLIIPDICGKFEDTSKISSKRYPEWFEKYLGKKYNWFLSGNDCYALRCSFLHEGSNQITDQRARDVLDYLVFIPNGSHLTKFSGCSFGDLKYDNKEILQLSVYQFCQDIIDATRQWIMIIWKDKSEILKIHEDGFLIGNWIHIQ